MIVIGVTGSFGTGKSTVAAMFRSLGAAVLDADRIAHGLIRPGGECFQKVVRRFGPEICRNGAIDRSRLAAKVFQDPGALTALERIVHPSVKKEMRRRIAAYRSRGRIKAVALDIPLLFESGLDRQTDVTVTVRANRRIQLARIMARGNLTRAEALRRIRAQMPLGQKSRLSDFIVDNDGPLNETKQQVLHIWNKIFKKEKAGNKWIFKE